MSSLNCSPSCGNAAHVSAPVMKMEHGGARKFFSYMPISTFFECVPERFLFDDISIERLMAVPSVGINHYIFFHAFNLKICTKSMYSICIV